MNPYLFHCLLDHRDAVPLVGADIEGAEALIALLDIGVASAGEIAAVDGAILEASEHDLPILIDGFIVTVAALMASRISPNCSRVMLFATRSAEKGHAKALEAISKISEASNLPSPSPPALSMGLRLGEATAGILAVPIARSAVSVLCDMATIKEILSG